MNYELQLQEINDKYYSKIKNAYGRYIKNFDNLPKLQDYTEFVSNGKVYNKLKRDNASGWFNPKTNKIYIRTDTVINDNLFIHEYIHLISAKKTWYGKIQLGLAKKKTLIDFNEALTEYFTYDITGFKNTLHPYSFAFPLVEFLIDRLGKEQLIECYFSGNIEPIKELLKNDFKLFLKNIYEVIDLAKSKPIKAERRCIELFRYYNTFYK